MKDEKPRQGNVEIKGIKRTILLLQKVVRDQENMAAQEKERIGGNRIKRLRDNGVISNTEGEPPTAEDIRMIQEALRIPYTETACDVTIQYLRSFICDLQEELNKATYAGMSPKEYKGAHIQAIARK